jgi:hypothetical protein
MLQDIDPRKSTGVRQIKRVDEKQVSVPYVVSRASLREMTEPRRHRGRGHGHRARDRCLTQINSRRLKL